MGIEQGAVRCDQRCLPYGDHAGALRPPERRTFHRRDAGPDEWVRSNHLGTVVREGDLSTTVAGADKTATTLPRPTHRQAENITVIAGWISFVRARSSRSVERSVLPAGSFFYLPRQHAAASRSGPEGGHAARRRAISVITTGDAGFTH
jgi:hypothetical protein